MKTMSQNAIGPVPRAMHPTGHDGPLAAAIDIARFVRAAVRDTLARRRQHRVRVARARQLAALDAVTLRDIGLHRSEAGSVAAELDGSAEPTRRRAREPEVSPLY